MKIIQTTTINDSLQQKFRFLIIRLVILVGVCGVAYFGYCFGLWGGRILLLQYLFQCNCPAISEEWRYPNEVDVIVPACRNIGTRISPSGRLLLVYERIEDNGDLTTYALNLQTNNEIPLTLPIGDIYFLTDNLIYIFVEYGHNHEGGEHIFDRTTNTMYPIQRFVYSHPGSYINGNADPVKLATALRQAKEVYFIDNSTDTAVALMSDFYNHPEHSFFISTFDFPYNGDLNRVEPFLLENNIAYQFTPANFPQELVSPDGRYIARRDGIYLIETNQKIVEGYTFSPYYRSYSGKYFSLRGWKYDSSGAIYSQFIGPCLLEFGFPGTDGPGCFFDVAQPVILLRVPREYLALAEIP